MSWMSIGSFSLMRMAGGGGGGEKKEKRLCGRAPRGRSCASGSPIFSPRPPPPPTRINENEPMLIQDMEQFLEKVAPTHAYYNHNDCAHSLEPQREGGPNGHSHCQQLLLGASEAVPVADGDLVLGQWPRLFLVVLDRGRDRGGARPRVGA